MPNIRNVRIVTPAQALVRLERLCARAEHCTSELQLRLRKWKITESESDRIIESLISRRYVDDERFARAFVSDRVRFRRHGRILVSRDLRLKGIDAAVIDQLLDEIDRDMYISNLRHIMQAKLRMSGTVALDTREGRMKLARFGMQRGYEPSLVIETIKILASERQD
ncbi:MAG: regulatory protein RecX [Bacteroidales bacterium]|nr:regulatory protein RecX [Bacteroidales bacterium]